MNQEIITYDDAKPPFDGSTDSKELGRGDQSLTPPDPQRERNAKLGI